jgi:hypothetical protein
VREETGEEGLYEVVESKEARNVPIAPKDMGSGTMHE